ncbi:MAG: hypothetical protein Q8S73_38995 [Deltaproteobacteria bacterium]|jgi:hypothetical protein|nr:hypothetical protein [Myxococcales bacterium]MDP3220154.1 hypothetical protein [Deltaproteobacteria bacterium]
MEILLDKRAVKQIRLSAQDAIEEGDTETLRDDILDSFSEDQVEEIERRIDTDFYDFLGDTLEEWSGEDVDELLDLLESQLADVGVELKFESVEAADDDADDDFDADDDDDLDAEEPVDDED